MVGDESRASGIFGLVGSEPRVAILRALASAYGESPHDPWLAYSALRDAAGIRDKGNFNYHLDRLDDLVVKGEPGYRISGLGMWIATAVASGDLDTDWTWGPVDAPGGCPYCADPVRLRYADGGLRLECGTEDHALVLAVSPSLLETAPEGEVVELVAAVVGERQELIRRGICPDCGAVLDVALERSGGDADHYGYHGDCGRCGMQFGATVGTLFVGHPEVVAFFAERGVDVRARPFWTLAFCEAGHEEVVSTDPLQVRVDVEHGDETLSLTLDGTADLVSTERPG